MFLRNDAESTFDASGQRLFACVVHLWHKQYCHMEYISQTDK